MPIVRTIAAVTLLGLSCSANAATAIHWQPWTPQLFAQAKAQHRFVLLDLEAVWCHWCHVMDGETYSDPKVIELIDRQYIAVKVDQDSEPDLSNRYGDYGWPATIVFAADGSEIVKRQGFMPPENMASLLQAIIDDPSPGPSVRVVAPVVAGATPGLSPAQSQRLQQAYVAGYDARYGGWGNLDKYIDADAMDYAVRRSLRGDEGAARMARQTLDAAIALVDPVWGGVDQYSATTDWKTPHYEKIISIQAAYLRIYSQAWARWHDPKYLATVRVIHGYLDTFLRSPEGAFYVSQDADLSETVDGTKYYSLNDASRRELGIPRVDTHVYSRENGWVIRALAADYDATGDANALSEAEMAANYVLAHRILNGGGFSHGEIKPDGQPYLGDSLAMAEGLLGLYRSTGDRRWLTHALAALDFIDASFQDKQRGGYLTAHAKPGAVGVMRSSERLPDENEGVVRVARLAYAYTGSANYQAMADRAMRYLAALDPNDNGGFMPGVLMADAEMMLPPVHLTVVGSKDDPAAKALHAAALGYPEDFKEVDWWDKREGPLPNAEVTYPELARPAAFICTSSTCSSPIFEPERIVGTLARLMQD